MSTKRGVWANQGCVGTRYLMGTEFCVCLCLRSRLPLIVMITISGAGGACTTLAAILAYCRQQLSTVTASRMGHKRDGSAVFDAHKIPLIKFYDRK